MPKPTPAEHAAFQAYLESRGEDADELAPLDYAEALGIWRTQERFAALEAENARLRDALRWRTVAADRLPPEGVRVLVERKDDEEKYRVVVAKYAGEFWGWSIPGVGLGVSEGDRWLPVPGEML